MKVVITSRLPESAVDRVRKDYTVEMNPEDRPYNRKELLSHVSGAVGMISMLTDKINAEVFDAAPELKMVANFAVGFDNFDVPEATKRGIKLSNTPGVLTDATADLVMALLLAVARRIVEGNKIVRRGDFKHLAPLLFLGTEVTRKTLGIIGLGNIGKGVAKRAAGFDMKILYHNRKRLPESEERSLNVSFAELNTLLAESDYISLNSPLTPDTRGLISDEQFAIMKPTAFLINAARGPIIDEKALVKALREGKIAGAGLDVYENEPDLTPGLTELDNVVLMPHSGSATLETRTKMAELAVDNLLDGLSGQTPPNCLNCKD